MSLRYQFRQFLWRCFWHFRWRLSALLILLALTSFSISSCSTLATRIVNRPSPDIVSDVDLRHFISYEKSIQPILNRRCVVCHSCNDAPCQLDQTSFAGIDRGANASDVYEGRMGSTAPTRIYIDATTTEAWRKLDFFPVLAHHPAGNPKNFEDSVLYQLIKYRNENPLPDIKWDAASSRTCPDLRSPLPLVREGILSLLDLKPYPYLAMPYGLPAISQEEFRLIRAWISLGAPGPSTQLNSSPQSKELEAWEEFFNGSSPKNRLVSRYLYEHFYYAHLYFSGQKNAGNNKIFYRLVRSKTPSPEPVEEIATRLPYDGIDGLPIYYRFKEYPGTIVAKTHLPYELNPTKLERLKRLFLSQNWDIAEEQLPDYDPVRSANPFLTFQAIPPQARYQFLLDDAGYFVGSFMKGPVCRGQIALNVINDHFFIFFLDPDSDLSLTNKSFFEATADSLMLPYRAPNLRESVARDGLKAIAALPKIIAANLKENFYPLFKKKELKYLKLRSEFYQRAYPEGFSLDDIWDGDGQNINAVLTAYRHFHSASVRQGAIGGEPATVLILDFPIFERMYYNLVADFDIFGSLGHQLATRLYMDNLRIEGEDLFLSFLPLDKRLELRNYWYRKAESEMTNDSHPLYGTTIGEKRGTKVPFTYTQSPKTELISMILGKRLRGSIAKTRDTLNRTVPSENFSFPKINSIVELEFALSQLTGKTGEFVQPLPDLSYLHFSSIGGDSSRSAVYTLIRNRAHFNVKYLFGESSRLDRENDTLNIVPGIEGSYPNFFFDIPFAEAEEFLAALSNLKTGDNSFSLLIKRFGVRRTDETKFWQVADRLQENFRDRDPINFGVFDLSRYENFVY